MSVTNPVSEYEALLYVVDRLAQRFPDVDEDSITTLVVEQFERLDTARLRQFVPVLVEGAVIRMLRPKPSPSPSPQP